ncbi:MAG: carbamoyl phosphate synthase small subunit [Deltaproteobacteria bacterium RIFCSPLOWO2_02_FULL_44_10]|nr:MAG: carbamoyl phosphate synthase small subunit [Deltaproteobacteria bacterium RIFCSPHIGHO2_02_FULL_44_16]OGQ45728.1 MAG: carbamoyl phosphate synthase small subunit [Deltaproteobacteria bacterium RIFCSPLOWO2_02_FULL_44_10]
MKKTPEQRQSISLVLEDGSVFSGVSFGALVDVEGEVVFNTGMVGYPESFTDPSYKGQILTLTYPLIGNYGVPASLTDILKSNFESDRAHISGLIVSEYSEFHHHWEAVSNLSDWLTEQKVPAISGIDTRMLTKKLRTKGSLRGRIIFDASVYYTPLQNDNINFVADVSIKEPVTYEGGPKRVALVDCGSKNTILKSLLARGLTVITVPWNFDVMQLDVKGVLYSNGPGDPALLHETILSAQKVLQEEMPIFGICLGNQILARAAGASTYKMKFGHRSQNQPCRMVGTQRCYITSQNHGYAVDTTTLPSDWESWFENANDGTNEGLRHKTKPFISVQFHPEAMPGPVDTGFLFDEFVTMLR